MRNGACRVVHSVRWAQWSTLVLSLNACTRIIRPGPVDPLPVPAPPGVQPHRPALSVTITGVATGEGGVYNGAFGPAAAHSPGPDQAAKLETGIQGAEERECGPTYHLSLARVSSVVNPVMDLARAYYSAELFAGLTVQGGFYQNHKLVWCGGHYVTSASATAGAEARVQFAFNPPAGTRDQLLMTLTGTETQRAAISVKGPGGHDVPLQPLPSGGLAVDLANPGIYLLVANISAKKAAKDDCPRPECQTSAQATLAVGLQSLRDALTLGYGEPGVAADRFAFSVLMPDTTMTRLVRENVFKERGRFYPCGSGPDCSKQGVTGVYLFEPKISILGGTLVLESRIGGCYNRFLICVKVSGTVRGYGAVFGDGAHVGANALQLEVDSKNLVVQIGTALLADRIESALRSGVVVDIGPQLERAKQAVNEKFPIRFDGGLCLAVRLNNIAFDRVSVISGPPGPGIVTHVAALTEPGTAAECAAAPRGSWDIARPVFKQGAVVPGARAADLVGALRQEAGFVRVP